MSGTPARWAHPHGAHIPHSLNPPVSRPRSTRTPADRALGWPEPLTGTSHVLEGGREPHQFC